MKNSIRKFGSLSSLRYKKQFTPVKHVETIDVDLRRTPAKVREKETYAKSLKLVLAQNKEKETKYRKALYNFKTVFLKLSNLIENKEKPAKIIVLLNILKELFRELDIEQITMTQELQILLNRTRDLLEGKTS